MNCKVDTMDELDKVCTLSKDEMEISGKMDFDKNEGKLIGRTTLGQGEFPAPHNGNPLAKGRKAPTENLGPPDWGLGAGITPLPCKNLTVTKPTNALELDWNKRNNERRPNDRIRMTEKCKKIRRDRDLFLATWNVRRLNRVGKTAMLRNVLEKYGVGIAALQEIRWKGNGMINLRNHTLFYSGHAQNTFGTGFLVDRKYKDRIMDFNAVSERICVLRVREKFFHISLICVHAPTNEANENDKDAFYESLEEIYRKIPDHDAKIVLGDFNAKIGREICFRPVIGIHSLHEESNANGLRVIDFASRKNMTVSSTYFKHKDIHKMTWSSPDGVTHNQIDHVLIDKRHGTDILDVRSYRGADCDTDHYLVKIKYRQRINNMKKF